MMVMTVITRFLLSQVLANIGGRVYCEVIPLPNKLNPMNVVSELICPAICTYLI
jgi:hypothetical protein